MAAAGVPRHPYRRLVARRLTILAALAALLCLSVAVDLSLGPARYALGDVVSTLLQPARAEV